MTVNTNSKIDLIRDVACTPDLHKRPWKVDSVRLLRADDDPVVRDRAFSAWSEIPLRAKVASVAARLNESRLHSDKIFDPVDYLDRHGVGASWTRAMTAIVWMESDLTSDLAKGAVPFPGQFSYTICAPTEMRAVLQLNRIQFWFQRLGYCEAHWRRFRFLRALGDTVSPSCPGAKQTRVIYE